MNEQRWIDAGQAWERALWNASCYADRDNSEEEYEDDEESDGEDG